MSSACDRFSNMDAHLYAHVFASCSFILRYRVDLKKKSDEGKRQVDTLFPKNDPWMYFVVFVTDSVTDSRLCDQCRQIRMFGCWIICSSLHLFFLKVSKRKPVCFCCLLLADIVGLSYMLLLLTCLWLHGVLFFLLKIVSHSVWSQFIVSQSLKTGSDYLLFALDKKKIHGIDTSKQWWPNKNVNCFQTVCIFISLICFNNNNQIQIRHNQCCSVRISVDHVNFLLKIDKHWKW